MIATVEQMLAYMDHLRRTLPPELGWRCDPALDWPANDDWETWRQDRRNRWVLERLQGPRLSREEKLLLVSRELGMEPWPVPDYDAEEAEARSWLLATAHGRRVVIQEQLSIMCERDNTITLKIKGGGTLRLGWCELESAWRNVKGSSYATTDREQDARRRLELNPIPVEWESEPR